MLINFFCHYFGVELNFLHGCKRKQVIWLNFSKLCRKKGFYNSPDNILFLLCGISWTRSDIYYCFSFYLVTLCLEGNFFQFPLWAHSDRISPYCCLCFSDGNNEPNHLHLWCKVSIKTLIKAFSFSRYLNEIIFWKQIFKGK